MCPGCTVKFSHANARLRRVGNIKPRIDFVTKEEEKKNVSWYTIKYITSNISE